MGWIGLQLTPWLRAEGLLGPNDPWRKIGFLIALGMILGAAIVDIGLLLREAWQRSKATTAPAVAETEDWKKTNNVFSSFEVWDASVYLWRSPEGAQAVRSAYVASDCAYL